VFAALCAAAPPAPAQLYTRPALKWETIRTAHFDVHFPSSMAPWANDVAGRLEGIREAVVAVVGNAPASRVTVMIEDPYNIANGAALPLLNAPTIVLWPTPPEPAGDLGHSPDWPALLAVHEFTHIAHLTWPSRNPFDRAVWQLLPADLGPISRRAPRWVIEGYATYVEGRLTGSGRPNSVVRAGVLRQFAIDGQLPTYGELDANPQYLGGDMAYLVGSAFLEWLVARQGEASLPHLWRRMTARTNRNFEAAFVGVFGETPDALYGRFTADLTGKALQAAALIRSSGLDSGETFQHLSWYTGDPAVAPAGHRIAVPVRQFGERTRIVVWSTDPVPPDTERAAARARALALDPGDVASVSIHPDQRAPLAILESSHGRGFDHPRFFADGQRLLVSHEEPLPDGALRPDLFEWNLVSGKVRRLTRGAAIRDADPSLGGKTAIGVRCLGGVCDVVLVDLIKGTVRVLLPGSPTRIYYRPRFAPDGRSVIVSVHDGTFWRLEIFAVQPRGLGAPKRIGPSD
ncbi:MAG TPA: hypothetical protein VIX35_11605, partial [Vicinamibacterales bacterium]